MVIANDQECLERLSDGAFFLAVPEKLEITLKTDQNLYIKVSDSYEFLFSCLKHLEKDFSQQIASEEADSINSMAEIDPKASVAPEASIAAGCKIEAGAVIFPHVTLAENVHVMANAVIRPRVSIAENSVVGSGAVIGGYGFGFTKQSLPKRIPQLGGVIIGKNCEIGPLCNIDSGTIDPTRIADFCKIDAGCHIAHNCVLGSFVFIAAQTGLSGSTIIHDDVQISGQCATTGHLEIHSGTRFAGRSVITKNIREAGTYAGYPAEPIADWRNKIAHQNRQFKNKKR